MIASPTDLVKVRMQAEQGGQKPRYPNARAAYPMIIRQTPFFLTRSCPVFCIQLRSDSHDSNSVATSL